MEHDLHVFGDEGEEAGDDEGAKTAPQLEGHVDGVPEQGTQRGEEL